MVDNLNEPKPETRPKRNRLWRPRERDNQILEYLLKNRFATAKRIGEIFFERLSTNVHIRRLHILKAKGLLETVPEDSGRYQVYRLTKKAVRHLKKIGTSTDSFRAARGINRGYIRHDDLLQDLRLVFESSPLIALFTPEHVLRIQLARKHGRQASRDERYKVPDAIFNLKRNETLFTVALELELARKSRARIAKMIKQLAISADFNLVFIVVEEEKQIGRLRQELLEQRKSDLAVRFYSPRKGFYFALLSDIRTKGLDARFSGEDVTFSLRDLEDPAPIEKGKPHPEADQNCQDGVQSDKQSAETKT